MDQPSQPSQHPFLALYVGWQQQNDDFVDTLYVGSNRNPIFHWDVNSNNACRSSFTIDPLATTMSHRSARVMVVEWDYDRYRILQSIQKKLPDHTVILDRTNVEEASSLPETLTDLVQSQLLTTTKIPFQDQPIHFVKLDSGDLDYYILTRQMRGLLPMIRYLVFEDSWKKSWGNKYAKLSTIIGMLKDHGLICYWAGDNHTDFSLWRITDCWQEYYNDKNWARIACVSHIHTDVAKLAQQMDQKFLATIQKTDHVF
jgi:hypothetical protein